MFWIKSCLIILLFSHSLIEVSMQLIQESVFYVPIRSKLNNFKSLSESELVNQPKALKYKFSIFSFTIERNKEF